MQPARLICFPAAHHCAYLIENGGSYEVEIGDLGDAVRRTTFGRHDLGAGSSGP
jgi:hypothetical protein